MIPIPPDVSVLNCGAGDMTFSFDKSDPLECARAERVVKDMLKRGYMLFAKVDGKYVRVTAFDAELCEYILADGPEASPSPNDSESDRAAAETIADRTVELLKKHRGKGKRVPARGTPVTGIAPTAGG